MTRRDRPTSPIPQWKLAAERSRVVRSGRARLKRELAAGRLALADALDHEYAATMSVRALLLTLPRFGEARAGRVLSVVGIRPNVQCVRLTERQRSGLVAMAGRRP